jgi:hypothetical protein
MTDQLKNEVWVQPIARLPHNPASHPSMSAYDYSVFSIARRVIEQSIEQSIEQNGDDPESMLIRLGASDKMKRDDSDATSAVMLSCT